MRTGILNVLELVHLLLKRGERAAANAAYEKYEPVVEGLSRKRIFESSRIRVQHSDRGLSYADAAGYATAREIGALFMTTDRGFAGLPGVRIVPG